MCTNRCHRGTSRVYGRNVRESNRLWAQYYSHDTIVICHTYEPRLLFFISPVVRTISTVATDHSYTNVQLAWSLVRFSNGLRLRTLANCSNTYFQGCDQGSGCLSTYICCKKFKKIWSIPKNWNYEYTIKRTSISLQALVSSRSNWIPTHYMIEMYHIHNYYNNIIHRTITYKWDLSVNFI